ncbi:MAG TPA: alpha-mannosidase [Ktedonobacterales bacterium]|nr:alpha-mannosidase [Ktedonobacterales bacterium]
MRPSTRRLRRGLTDLGSAIYRDTMPLERLRMLPLGTRIAPGEMPMPADDAPGWRPSPVGSQWGGVDENAWFRAEAQVPEAWLGEIGTARAVVLRLLLGRGSNDWFGWPEGLLYVNSRLQQGINRHHTDVLLREEDVRTGALRFDVRAWSGLLTTDHHIERADIALLDRECEALYYLLGMGSDAVDAIHDNVSLADELAAALRDAFDRLTIEAAGTPQFDVDVRESLGWLRTRLGELREQLASPSGPVVTAVGHGHLDVAWLWQTRHTREKTARTFGIATALMEHYPEYCYLHTTPQVFAWLERDYPTLFERVQEEVRAGRFEAGGAMWLESDCNLVSGEALVRQIVYGQRYLRETFGREYDTLWLPDAFGYSAALPQIMLRAGIPVFMTTKMSWSDTNRIPADTFRWRGTDGSEVLAHFITTPTFSVNPIFQKMDTYNGALNVPAVVGVWERYRQKDLNREVLLAFGHGDGGAGPTRQYLEQARAIRELPGLPELRLGRADAFFARLRERVWTHPDLPVWDGEMYLEYHRGTYTTQAWLKRTHRQNEARLLAAETLDAWRWSLTGDHAPDTRAALDDAWRTLLLHEFHDILPGSSIGAVYDDARRDLSALAANLDDAIAESLRAVLEYLRVRAGSLAVFNSSPFPAPALLEVPEPNAGQWYTANVAGKRQPLRTQPLSDASGNVLLEVLGLPALGVIVLEQADADTPVAESDGARADGRTLESACFRVELNDTGEIISCVDKRVHGGRELVTAGHTLNHLQAFDDRPANFDAWDIDATYEQRPLPLGDATVEVLERGPVRATMLVTRRFRFSTIKQRISVYDAIPRIDCNMRIEWHEHHVLLKAAFPLDLRSRVATSEIQYGAIERPTHRNTSWDAARFETVAHRWIDFSEASYGVSLLNDGRYGHDVHDNVVRITLLRSPTDPDPEADQGMHEVTYSLYPHLGDWRTGGTVAAAYALNRQPYVAPVPQSVDTAESVQTERAALFSTGVDGVVIEAVKRHERDDGVIIRVYEAHGARRRADFHAARPIREVIECDLLERPLRADRSAAYQLWAESAVASHDVPTVEGAAWSCDMRPYEVRTFHVRWA